MIFKVQHMVFLASNFKQLIVIVAVVEVSVILVMSKQSHERELWLQMRLYLQPGKENREEKVLYSVGLCAFLGEETVWQVQGAPTMAVCSLGCYSSLSPWTGIQAFQCLGRELNRQNTHGFVVGSTSIVFYWLYNNLVLC